MVSQMHHAKGKGYLKWTHPRFPAALTTPQKVWSIWELVKLKKVAQLPGGYQPHKSTNTHLGGL